MSVARATDATLSVPVFMLVAFPICRIRRLQGHTEAWLQVPDSHDPEFLDLSIDLATDQNLYDPNQRTILETTSRCRWRPPLVAQGERCSFSLLHQLHQNSIYLLQLCQWCTHT